MFKKLLNSKDKKLLSKGFTLIELLAVIIILAIVALIATPIILDVIDDSRISAGRSEAQIIYSGISDYCQNEKMTSYINSTVTRICTSSMTKEDVPKMVNLGNAEVVELNYDGNDLINLVVNSNGHKFTLCINETFAIDDEECGTINTGSVKNVVLSSFPELKTIGEGCIQQNDYNYSYMDGCYLKGTQSENYIWYSGFLWRIMGINADGTIRMITDENITTIPFGEKDTYENYDNSHVKEWLNDYFYNNLKDNDIIIEQVWCSEIQDYDSQQTTCSNLTQLSNVGLLTVDEYNLSGGLHNYLDLGQEFWTMTLIDNEELWKISQNGNVGNNFVGNGRGIRAIINVDANAIITGGSGTVGENGEPYILNEEMTEKSGENLNDISTSGEHVLFANKLYRIVSKDEDGNTKLILDGYYEEPDGTIYITNYGNDSSFSTSSGIGQKLNTDVLEWLVPNTDTSNRGKLVTDYVWYQNGFDYNYNYKESLDEENPDSTYQATVGLIRIGEMLSGQSSSILTKSYTATSDYRNATTYYSITPFTDSTSVWFIRNYGNSSYDLVSLEYAIRPVIVIKSNVKIISGNGTWSNPYVI